MSMAKRADGWPLFWFGLAGAALVAVIGALGVHNDSVFGVQRALKAEVESALSREGMDFATVEMQGQRAVLAGVAPSEEAIAQAGLVAFTAAGAGGAWAGGITSVDTAGLAVGAPVSPFAWEAVRAGDQLILRGAVPSAPARARLVRDAERAFPELQVVDEMSLAAGAPGPAWSDVARTAIAQLATLQTGQARLVDERLVLIGEGEPDAVAAVERHYAAPLPAPFGVRLEVTGVGQGPAIAAIGDVDLSGGDAAQCQEAFARIMQRNVINFETGSAVIDASSLALLSDLASVALRCDRSVITVSGHTDNVGTRGLNMALSQERAEAVVRYLRSQGVRADRLAAIGYGPDRPRADNRTSAGQAANRRIEFEVR